MTHFVTLVVRTPSRQVLICSNLRTAVLRGVNYTFISVTTVAPMLCLPCMSLLPSPPSTRGTNGYYYTFCTRRCGASQELYDGDGPVPTVPTTGLSPRVSFERSCGVILAASCKYLRSLWARAGGSHVDGGGRSRLLARAGGGRGCSCVVPVAAVSDACALYPWLPCPMSREIGTRASSAQ